MEYVRQKRAFDSGAQVKDSGSSEFFLLLCHVLIHDIYHGGWIAFAALGDL